MIISLLIILIFNIFKINVWDYQDLFFKNECDKKYHYITVPCEFVEVLIYIYNYNTGSFYVSAQ